MLRRRNVREIFNYIKDLISLDIGNRAVVDTDVANALDVKPSTLSTWASRGKIPHDEIIAYAIKKDLPLDDILLERGNKYVLS